MNKIHEHIKAFRKEKGLTQEEVAKELFVTRQLISKWEQGSSLPDIESVEKLAKIFGVTINDLIDDESVKSITLKEAIKNKSKNKFIWLSIAFSVLALITTSIFLLMNRLEEDQIILEGYFYVTEIDTIKRKYVFKNSEQTLSINGANHNVSVIDEREHESNLEDLKVNDNVKLLYTNGDNIIHEVHVIDSKVEKSLYGVFVADQNLDFEDLSDIRDQYEGVRYMYDTDGSSGSNIITEFSYVMEGHYHERTYKAHIMIDPLKVQNGLRIGLITSEGIEYVDEVDLTTQRDYTYEGAYALDLESVNDINSIHIRYIVIIQFVPSFHEIIIYEYDKNNTLITETNITSYIELNNFNTNTNTLYGYFRTTAILGTHHDSTYEDVDVSSIYVGVTKQVYIADSYGVVRTHFFHFS